ncbi:MAG TPA: YraN family protein [Methylophilaceae bacterium]|nr:YraN family protein [Methylophilaceae bacterium]
MSNLGGEAEKIAAVFLQQQGLIIVANNYRCRFGEIDLIAQEGNTLVFVEVRLRSSSSFGGAGTSITQVKQQKLTRTAEFYLQQNGTAACRFDAILMNKPDIKGIEWIKNAFDA